MHRRILLQLRVLKSKEVSFEVVRRKYGICVRVLRIERLRAKVLSMRSLSLLGNHMRPVPEDADRCIC